MSLPTNYKCIKCGNGISATSHPTVGNCSKGGSHEWVVNDGKQKNYKCIKCGNGVAASSPPLVGKCSKGGEHEWVS
jgi:DNA-directed RNA polymerase subunit RPC12/RpoP